MTDVSRSNVHITRVDISCLADTYIMRYTYTPADRVRYVVWRWTQEEDRLTAYTTVPPALWPHRKQSFKLIYFIFRFGSFRLPSGFALQHGLNTLTANKGWWLYVLAESVCACVCVCLCVYLRVMHGRGGMKKKHPNRLFLHTEYPCVHIRPLLVTRVT